MTKSEGTQLGRHAVGHTDAMDTRVLLELTFVTPTPPAGCCCAQVPHSLAHSSFFILPTMTTSRMLGAFALVLLASSAILAVSAQNR